MIDLEAIVNRLAKGKVRFVIVGGVAATVYGSSFITDDLDICYARDKLNLDVLAETLAPLNPRLRGAPSGLPFIWDAETLLKGLNFTLRIDLGDLDLLGEISGIGRYEQMRDTAINVVLFGVECSIISLENLISAKRAAGRAKDRLVLPELEALLEATKDQTE
jgi:predicted nucleotidyltransferase